MFGANRSYVAVLAACAMSCLLASTAVGADLGASGPGLGSAVISLRDIDCQSCGMAAVKMLETSKGVERASFDRDAAELTVSYSEAETDPERLVSAVRELGYDAVVGAGKGR